MRSLIDCVRYKKLSQICGVRPATELAELPLANQYFRIQDVAERNLAGRQTASVWPNYLAENGILEEAKVRQKFFIDRRALGVLTSS